MLLLVLNWPESSIEQNKRAFSWQSNHFRASVFLSIVKYICLKNKKITYFYIDFSLSLPFHFPGWCSWASGALTQGCPLNMKLMSVLWLNDISRFTIHICRDISRSRYITMHKWIDWTTIFISGDTRQIFLSRVSTSEYRQPPSIRRVFQTNAHR